MNMIKPKMLQKGSTIAVVSLSSGVLGEPFMQQQLRLGVERIESLGFRVKFMPNALKGINFIKENPQARANDLKEAFLDDEVDAILCAIGGSDSYLVTDILHQDQQFAQVVCNNPKMFIGYSDATTSHMFLNGLGLITFYGMTFLSDFAEHDKEMLPYTKQNFEAIIKNPETFNVESSEVWYEERKTFDNSQFGVPRIRHKEQFGHICVKGSGVVEGLLFGGCLESIIQNLELKDSGKYSVFLDNKYWEGIMLIETSEYKITPLQFKDMLLKIERTGAFDKIKGVVFGKPQDQQYMFEYIDIIKEVFKDKDICVLANINIGHAQPHTLLPLGVKYSLNCDACTLTCIEKAFA